MKRSRFSDEQIIAILKEQEAGMATAEICRRHGISGATIYIYGRFSRCKRFGRRSGDLGCQHLSALARDVGAPKWIIRAA